MSFRKGFDIALPLPSLIGSVSNNYLDINKRDILLFFRGTGVRDLEYHTSLRKAATQLSLYNKKIIIDKINSYFGYTFIKNIQIKIISTKFTDSTKTNRMKKIKSSFDNDLKKVDDLNLKSKLEKLINAYNEKK